MYKPIVFLGDESSINFVSYRFKGQAAIYSEPPIRTCFQSFFFIHAVDMALPCSMSNLHQFNRTSKSVARIPFHSIPTIDLLRWGQWCTSTLHLSSRTGQGDPSGTGRAITLSVKPGRMAWREMGETGVPLQGTNISPTSQHF